jgi:two-component system chemotaxis response regulator CheY
VARCGANIISACRPKGMEFQKIFAEPAPATRVCSTKPVPISTLDASQPPVPPPPGGPARILYAEDLRELREVMRVIVEAQGYQIETVSDGDEALQRLTAEPAAFDVLITDHHMPRMNGLELVQRLLPGAFKGKIMVFSSELDPGVHREYHRLGVAVILPKPIRPAVLRKALADLVPVS